MLVKLPRYKVIEACDRFTEEFGETKRTPEHIAPYVSMLVFRNTLLKVKTQYVYLEKNEIDMLGDFIEWEE